MLPRDKVCKLMTQRSFGLDIYLSMEARLTYNMCVRFGWLAGSKTMRSCEYHTLVSQHEWRRGSPLYKRERKKERKKTLTQA